MRGVILKPQKTNVSTILGAAGRNRLAPTGATHLIQVNRFYLRLCVCVCVRQLFCPRDNSSHVPARIIKFGQKKYKRLLKICIVFLVDWPWPASSNLTSFQNSVYMHSGEKCSVSMIHASPSHSIWEQIIMDEPTPVPMLVDMRNVIFLLISNIIFVQKR